MKEAMKLAASVLKGSQEYKRGHTTFVEAVEEIEAAMAQQQEPVVTVLPDGSAFSVATFPLPPDHWLYAPYQYMPGHTEPVELPTPVTTHADRDRVAAAIRYAVRGATMCGKDLDFDPDALVQNAVYALCGPFNAAPQPAQQEPVKIITPLMEQQMFVDWCPYKGSPDPRIVWSAAVDAVNKLLLAAAPQPAQQEPWLVFLRNNPKASCETVGAWLRGHAEYVTGERFYFPQQPAQSKPLDAGEVSRLWKQHTSEDGPHHNPYDDDGLEFALAIESAHNIKEQP